MRWMNFSGLSALTYSW